MISALFTNPNWDSKENDRPGRIKELNGHYNRAIELVYNPDIDDDDEPDWDNPFWQGHLRSIARTRTRWGLAEPNGTMRDVIEAEGHDVDEVLQLEREVSSQRHRMRQDVDQLN
jgi:hypothetical protein